MVSNFTQGNVFLTPDFRLSFPSLFQKSGRKGSKPSFSMKMLFPKSSDITILKSALREVMTARWGKDAPSVTSPFIDGDTKKYAGYAGMIVVKAANYVYDEKNEHKARPGVVDCRVDPIISPAEMYPGCWARAKIFAKATGGPGTEWEAKVSFGIRNVQKIREDEAFGSALVGAEEDFEAFGTAPVSTPMQAEAPIAPKATGQDLDFLNAGMTDRINF
jgi:hypothetical protein